jgi:hypothetical protein
MNLCKALTRVSACREDEWNLQDLHKNILKDQYRPVRDALLGVVRDRVTVHMAQLQDAISEQNKYAQIVHPKRRIRLLAWGELINYMGLNGLFTKHIAGKIKLYENAKPGKYPRLIGDYTTPGSLLGGYLCEIVKKSFSEVRYNKGDMDFNFLSSVEASALDEVGRRLFDGTEDYALFFSDDSVMKLNGKIYEMDISSCDMSNRQPIFKYLSWLCSGTEFGRDIMQRNIAQCTLPLRLKDPSRLGKTISLNPAYPIEFSGTTLTTALNNIASFLIMLQCKLMGANSRDDVIAAARSIGYIVTVEERTTMETVQFLKHSFYRDDKGDVRSWLNLGPILRSFGSCVGDKAKGIEYDWNATVLSGYVHSGQTSLQRKLNDFYPLRSRIRLPQDEIKHFSSEHREDTPDRVVLARYGITGAEWAQCIDLVSRRGHVNCVALRRIYQVDYGLA